MPNKAISALIDLALAHAASLRRAAQGDASETGAETTRREAEKWEKAIAQAVHENSDTR